MTDNEIIKALECCADAEYQCQKCTLYGKCYDGMVCELALDLINRQKAEIARLEKIAEETYESAVIALNVAKADAVKVFAENLKDDISNHRLEMYMNGLKGTPRTREITYECVKECIDNLVKEMVGDNNG